MRVVIQLVFGGESQDGKQPVQVIIERPPRIFNCKGWIISSAECILQFLNELRIENNCSLHVVRNFAADGIGQKPEPFFAIEPVESFNKRRQV